MSEELSAALEEIRGREQAATPGPWWFDEDGLVWRLHGVRAVMPPQLDGLIPEQVINHQILKAPKQGTPYAEYWPNDADAAFIVAARTDIPLLLAALDAAQAKADEWDAADPSGSALAEDRAWIRQQCAAELREAITRELTGKAGDGHAETAVAASCGLDQQWLGYWGEQPTGVACGEPSCATVRLTCKHEYRLDEVRVCSGCASDMQQASGQITCKRCWDADDRHACYCLVVIDWDSGEKTTVQEAHRD